MSIATRGHRFQWSSPWFLAVVTVIALVTLGAGAGYVGGLFRPSGHSGAAVAVSPTTSPTPSINVSPSASPSQVPSQSPSPSPSSAPSASPSPGQGQWGILVKDFRPAGGGNYIATLVDTTGAVTARATPANRTHPAGVLVQMPNISASNSTLYYLDGDSTVKFLKPDGTTGTIRSLLVNTDSAVVFAVSPDDIRIAVASITFSPASTHLYVEDLAGGNRVDLTTPASELGWPVGWHDGHLVLGVGTNAPPSSDEGYAYGPMGYRIVDATAGNLLGTICAGKSVIGPPMPAGTLCVDSANDYLVVDWSGATRSIPLGTACAPGALSPDGELVADNCSYGGNTRVVDRYGTMIDGAQTARPLGWIDNTLFIARAPSGPLSLFTVSSRLDAGWTSSILASGFFAGRIPGGL